MWGGTSAPQGAVDVHQHLWPTELIDRLRARRRTPYLRGWTLYTHGEAPFDVRPEDHEPVQRAWRDADDDIGLSCVSLSAPLGIESLPPREARPLLDAWHAGAARLPDAFAAWTSLSAVDPDLGDLRAQLAGGFVGLQLPATQLGSPYAWDQALPILQVVAEADRALLVHPGPETPTRDPRPAWWPATVGYVAQLQAAWWGFHAAQVRTALPRLRVLFAAGAGLAPLQFERYSARGGELRPLDRFTYVDTSSYGRQAIDALSRVLGIDQLVLGSDRPYAEPADDCLGAAARHALRVTNPRRALGIAQPTKEAISWQRAS